METTKSSFTQAASGLSSLTTAASGPSGNPAHLRHAQQSDHSQVEAEGVETNKETNVYLDQPENKCHIPQQRVQS